MRSRDSTTDGARRARAGRMSLDAPSFSARDIVYNLVGNFGGLVIAFVLSFELDSHARLRDYRNIQDGLSTETDLE